MLPLLAPWIKWYHHKRRVPDAKIRGLLNVVFSEYACHVKFHFVSLFANSEAGPTGNQ